MAEKKPDPSKKGKAQERMSEAVAICRDVYGGTLRMREKGTKYLPKFPKETERTYRRRKEAAVLFNAFKRTVKGLAGMVYRKEPKLEGLDEATEDHLKDIDLSGRDLATFGKDHLEDALIDGHALIFVDLDVPAEGFETAAAEEAAGLRPYWVQIQKQQVLRARTQRIAGRVMLTHFAYHETTVEAVDDFTEREVERVRQYKLVPVQVEDRLQQLGVVYQLWEKRKDEENKEDWREVTEGPTTLWVNRRLGAPYPEIPVAVTYGERLRVLESEPPLLDLALENIRHFQKQSDRDNVEHVASVPILTATGISKEEFESVEVGPTVAVVIDNPDGSLSFAEPKGTALQSSRESLEDIERHMALLGLSMLMSETRAPETATSKRIDKAESDSALAGVARSHESALMQALYFHEVWQSDDGEVELADVGAIEVNRDFENLQVDPQLVQVVADLVPGKLSLDTLWDFLVAGEILPESFDAQLEKGRIETQGEAGLQAVAAFLRGRQGSPADDGGAS